MVIRRLKQTDMYKGQIKGFPQEVVEKMLERQVEQGNKRDITVFEKESWTSAANSGFTWCSTVEDDDFWTDVIGYKKFDLFFEKYPKKELPRMVMVSNNGAVWCEAEYFCTIKHEHAYIAAEYCNEPCGWIYMKEIETKPIPEYTMQELQDKIGEEFKLKK